MMRNVLKGNDDMADKAGIAQIVPKWQPIATAPTDGTMVLVYAVVLHPEKWGIELDPIICAAAYHEDAGFCVCEVRDATHWMPLPEPPTATS